jgi:hypothetical protein
MSRLRKNERNYVAVFIVEASRPTQLFMGAILATLFIRFAVQSGPGPVAHTSFPSESSAGDGGYLICCGIRYRRVGGVGRE